MKLSDAREMKKRVQISGPSSGSRKGSSLSGTDRPLEGPTTFHPCQFIPMIPQPGATGRLAGVASFSGGAA
jgi:hypothetical protein